MRLDHEWYDRDLPTNVRLGQRSWVYSSYAFLHCRSQLDPCVTVGDDAGVYDGTMFELGPSATVEIGAYSSVVAAVIRLEGTLIIEDHALISWDVHISDVSDEAPLPPGSVRAQDDRRTTRIESGAWIGARAVLMPGASVGRDAIVGAGAVVRESVPDATVVIGNPARVVRGAPADVIRAFAREPRR